MKLTIQGIDFSPIKDLPYKIFDGNGLFLLISKAGTKTWYLKYRRGKKQTSMPLGRYPEVGLAAARLAASKARQLLAAARDPALERKRKQQALMDAADATFRKFGDEWLDDYTPIWSPSNAKRVRNRLERDLYPEFGSIPIGMIDSSDILRVLRKI